MVLQRQVTHVETLTSAANSMSSSGLKSVQKMKRQNHDFLMIQYLRFKFVQKMKKAKSWFLANFQNHWIKNTQLASYASKASLWIMNIMQHLIIKWIYQVLALTCINLYHMHHTASINYTEYISSVSILLLK